MDNNKPIGLFDSGIGGTSIWSEIHELLPNEKTIYLADSKNAPYGERSKDEIISLSIKNTAFLLEKDCKIIVVACNTATTNAIAELRSRYDVPFIGIEPAIKPAAIHSTTQKIGILATKGTLSSELFNKAVEIYQETTIIEQVGFGLVRLIENGLIDSDEMNKLLLSYLTPMIEADIDCLVLGCSHYPYLIPQIKKILPAHVKIIDSGRAVANHTQKILKERIGFNSDQNIFHTFYSNSNSQVLKQILNKKYHVIESDF